MARYERGVYEPSDEVRVFDGAEDDEDDEGSRLPLLIVLALVVLCAFAGVVWLAYTQGVARGRTETPVLAAAPGPEKVAPQNAGGAKVPYQGFKIYEQPAPPDDEVTAPPAPAEAAKAEAPPPKPEAVKPTPLPARVAAAAPPTTKPAPAPPAAKPVTTAPAKPVSPPPVLKQAVAPPPASVPRTAPSAPNPSVATGAPRTLPGVAAAPPPQAAKAITPPQAAKTTTPPAAPASSGGFVVQVGAYKSQEEADNAWKAYKARHAALLSGYNSNVQKVDLGEKGIWYRLRVAGFASRDAAAAFCDRLKAAGKSCFVR
jgi:cell division protein FtsN